MTRLKKLLAAGALVAAPLALAAIPAQPAHAAGIFIGAAPAPTYYACDPYYCGYAYAPSAGVGISVGGWGGHGGGWHHHWR